MTEGSQIPFPELDASRVVAPFSRLSEVSTLKLWGVALLLFIVGDVGTTGIGYRMDGVYEVSPLPAFLLSEFGIIALLVLKMVVAGMCYLVWTTVPREYGVGIPVAMAILGGFATIWNLTVMMGGL